MKYLLMMQVDRGVLDSLTAEQNEAIGTGHGAFMDAITASGEFILTQALGDPAESSVIRASGGVPQVQDGPFLEAKEFLGGFYLVDVDSKERALELAAMIPDSKIDGLAIEVRPVMFSKAADF
ncbi:YciI family protein [Lacisediminihabitans sp.]|uniref:YciI family protein n=1 Tax=Lacisediminihabitans sp. TaxID=2787631 RepID=UPI00374CEB88